ncbi:MAG: YdcH family protein, partial [Thermoanaerobaculia bacterium]|nr:YdcH family protein [Thermoanaerobaculia bacterium]
MQDPETQLKQELIATDDEFRRLHEEHQALERRLEQLVHADLLSQRDEQEEKQIKLQKLRLKDRMEAILRAHREQQVPV